MASIYEWHWQIPYKLSCDRSSVATAKWTEPWLTCLIAHCFVIIGLSWNSGLAFCFLQPILLFCFHCMPHTVFCEFSDAEAWQSRCTYGGDGSDARRICGWLHSTSDWCLRYAPVWNSEMTYCFYLSLFLVHPNVIRLTWPIISSGCECRSCGSCVPSQDVGHAQTDRKVGIIAIPPLWPKVKVTPVIALVLFLCCFQTRDGGRLVPLSSWVWLLAVGGWHQHATEFWGIVRACCGCGGRPYSECQGQGNFTHICIIYQILLLDWVSLCTENTLFPSLWYWRTTPLDDHLTWFAAHSWHVIS